jgi:hypothetical protein
VKTSSKLTAALLATLVVGGSSAGSLFTAVLNEGSSSSLGTAGTFFSTLNLPEGSVSVASVLAPKSEVVEVVEVVVANAKPTPTPSLVSTAPATEVRALTQEPAVAVVLEVSPVPEISVQPEPSLTPQPEPTVSPEPEPTVSPEPEVSPSSIPTPEPTEPVVIEEPSSIEP